MFPQLPLLEAFPFHLKDTIGIQVVSVCGESAQCTIGSEQLPLIDWVYSEVIAVMLGGNHQHTHLSNSNSSPNETLPPLCMACDTLFPNPNGSYSLPLKQSGSLGNQSTFRDACALLPGLISPGSTMFWCFSLREPLQDMRGVESWFRSALQPLLDVFNLARWARISGEFGSCEEAHVVAVLHSHISCNESSLLSILQSTLGTKRCRIVVVPRLGDINWGEFVGANSPLPTIGATERALRDIQSVSTLNLRKEIPLTGSWSVFDTLKYLSEMKGGSDWVAVADGFNQGSLSKCITSFTVRDAVESLEDRLAALGIKFRASNPEASTVELEAYLRSQAHQFKANLKEANITVDAMALDDVATAEIATQLSSLEARKVGLEQDRRRHEIQHAIKNMIDVLDAASTRVARCL